MPHPATNKPPYLVADLFLQALADAKVDYIFAVLGSDHPSIIEAYARRQSHESTAWPRMLIFQHEFMAISAADGYGRMTHRSQCVLVHTDVGTLALGQGLHNASTDRSPMLIFAGLAPLTFHGEVPGSRSESVQWMQDVPNQSSIVAPYVNYANEIKSSHHVRIMVNRALSMAESGSPGPTYITAAREILAASAEEAAISSHCIRPIVITGYLGRCSWAVESVLQLADLVQGLKLIDTEFREMSFPADHPDWTTMSTGGLSAVQSADLILVLDSDVPWIPIECRPAPTAQVFHIDVDVTKKKIQLFDLLAEASFGADCGFTLEKINQYIGRHRQLAQRQSYFKQRWRKLKDEHAMRQRTLIARALPKADGSISSDHLFAKLRQVLPVDTTYVHDAVTNRATMFEQLQLVIPGTALAKGGSGLGWAGGAAIGVFLAMNKYKTGERPHLTDREQADVTQPFIVSVTGDGGFMFGNPCATHWAQHRLKTPFLTIILNNEDGPDYVGIAIAASNGTLWGKQVRNACDLEAALQAATRVVKEEKRGALLEVVIS